MPYLSVFLPKSRQNRFTPGHRPSVRTKWGGQLLYLFLNPPPHFGLGSDSLLNSALLCSKMSKTRHPQFCCYYLLPCKLFSTSLYPFQTNAPWRHITPFINRHSLKHKNVRWPKRGIKISMTPKVYSYNTLTNGLIIRFIEYRHGLPFLYFQYLTSDMKCYKVNPFIFFHFPKMTHLCQRGCKHLCCDGNSHCLWIGMVSPLYFVNDTPSNDTMVCMHLF